MQVIKLGGSLLEDSLQRAKALRAIVDAWHSGADVVVVHGGGKRVDAMLARFGIPKRTHAGLRITDDATLEVVVSVLGGLVNKSLVAELTAMGVRAAGISGSDGNTVMAERHPPIDGIDPEDLKLAELYAPRHRLESHAHPLDAAVRDSAGRFVHRAGAEGHAAERERR